MIRELSLDLGRFTVLVGPNACGKSSVPQGIAHLCAMRDTAPQELFTGKSAIEIIRARHGSDDEPMAAVLAHLKLAHQEYFDTIKKSAISVISALRDIRIRPATVRAGRNKTSQGLRMVDTSSQDMVAKPLA
ncbi:MAG: ATP-binding protein [Proteobacteria bacterium]|nr:ATP-binding protein [Pseudomonadota bacterium]